MFPPEDISLLSPSRGEAGFLLSDIEPTSSLFNGLFPPFARRELVEKPPSLFLASFGLFEDDSEN